MDLEFVYAGRAAQPSVFQSYLTQESSHLRESAIGLNRAVVTGLGPQRRAARKQRRRLLWENSAALKWRDHRRRDRRGGGRLTVGVPGRRWHERTAGRWRRTGDQRRRGDRGGCPYGRRTRGGRCRRKLNTLSLSMNSACGEQQGSGNHAAQELRGSQHIRPQGRAFLPATDQMG